MPTNLKELQHEILTQDNRMTANPIFIVQQKKRIYGIDSRFGEGDGFEWGRSGYGEADTEKAKELEAIYQDTGEEPGDWVRQNYIDTWDFVTCCFTEKGCEDYISLNGHNLNESRIYVASGYRNSEWEFLREFLKDPKIDSESK